MQQRGAVSRRLVDDAFDQGAQAQAMNDDGEKNNRIGRGEDNGLLGHFRKRERARATEMHVVRRDGPTHKGVGRAQSQHRKRDGKQAGAEEIAASKPKNGRGAKQALRQR